VFRFPRISLRWTMFAIVIGALAFAFTFPRVTFAQDLADAGVSAAAPSSATVVDVSKLTANGDPGTDVLLQWGSFAWQAVHDRDWKLLVGLVLLACVWGLRKAAAWLATKRGSTGKIGAAAAFFATAWGARLLVLLGAAMGGLGSAACGHKPFDLGLVSSIVTMAVLAAGGWSLLLEPVLELAKKKIAGDVQIESPPQVTPGGST
jgi:hypothetical protein